MMTISAIPGVGGMSLRALMLFRESFVYTVALTSDEPLRWIMQALNDMLGLSIWLRYMKVDDDGAIHLGDLAGALYVGHCTREQVIEALEDVFTAEDIKALLDIIDVKDA